jgi:hypothetical protein
MGHYDKDYESYEDEKKQETAKRKKAWKRRNKLKLDMAASSLTVGELFELFQQLQDDLDGK